MHAAVPAVFMTHYGVCMCTQVASAARAGGEGTLFEVCMEHGIHQQVCSLGPSIRAEAGQWRL